MATREHGDERWVVRIEDIRPTSIYGYRMHLNCGHWVHRKVAKARINSVLLCPECYKARSGMAAGNQLGHNADRDA